MQLKYMVTEKRGRFEPITRDETDKRLSFEKQRSDPKNFKGSITFGLVKEDGLPAEWEEFEITVLDLDVWSKFKHGEIRTVTIGDPE